MNVESDIFDWHVTIIPGAMLLCFRVGAILGDWTSKVSGSSDLADLELRTLKKGVLGATRGRREDAQEAEALERAAALNIPEACARGENLDYNLDRAL